MQPIPLFVFLEDYSGNHKHAIPSFLSKNLSWAFTEQAMDLRSADIIFSVELSGCLLVKYFDMFFFNDFKFMYCVARYNG